MIRGILGNIKQNKKRPDFLGPAFPGYLKKGFRSRGILDKG
jgi:hypothetical protein